MRHGAFREKRSQNPSAYVPPITPKMIASLTARGIASQLKPMINRAAKPTKNAAIDISAKSATDVFRREMSSADSYRSRMRGGWSADRMPPSRHACNSASSQVRLWLEMLRLLMFALHDVIEERSLLFRQASDGDQYNALIHRRSTRKSGRNPGTNRNLRTPWNSAAAVLAVESEFGQRGQQRFADKFQPLFVLDLLASQVGDVENVDHLVEVRGDLGQLDGKSQLVNGAA